MTDTRIKFQGLTHIMQSGDTFRISLHDAVEGKEQAVLFIKKIDNDVFEIEYLDNRAN